MNLIQESDWLLWQRWWNFRFPKMRRISWIAEEWTTRKIYLLASVIWRGECYRLKRGTVRATLHHAVTASCNISEHLFSKRHKFSNSNSCGFLEQGMRVCRHETAGYIIQLTQRHLLRPQTLFPPTGSQSWQYIRIKSDTSATLNRSKRHSEVLSIPGASTISDITFRYITLAIYLQTY